ncbi:MAG: HNH endonuclease [Phycisphaerales bacterium]|nr:HNH endonuclease [Phycisphaerales bacterium]MCB9863802.1 HNH endonuclease [Phycisphaerales bacterium]
MFAQPSATSLNVLVLNRHYLAIRIINVRRAFTLLFKELAEVIHVDNGKYLSYDFSEWCDLSQLAREFEPAEHDWIKTVRFDIAVPRIIRLAVYDRLPRQEVKFNRRNLFARDSNRCQYCGNKFPTSELSLDHVVPRSQGGGATWENIVCACVKCNIRKGGRTPKQASMHLIRSPSKPRRNPSISIKLADNRYASWKAFLDNAYWSVELR